MALLFIIMNHICCKAQSTPNHSTYSNKISLDGDSRTFYLEFEGDNPSMIRWGIEKAGRHRLPLINSTFDTISNSFSGDLSFFGNEVFNSISGTLDGDKIKGNLIWHKSDTIPFSLDRVKRKLSYREEPVSFHNGGIELKGTLILPTEQEGPFPVAVFAHGSGFSTRWWGMYWAAELSKIGMATLLYDKRGCGESIGGSWGNSSLDDLALDIVSAMKFLERHPAINKNKIGVYGVSQGGWIASRVCAMNEKTAFIISNSGGGISPYDEEIFSYRTNMKFAGIDESGIEEGIGLVKKYLDYLKTGEKRNELAQLMDDNREKDWFPVLGLERIFVSEKNRKNWEWIATYVPRKDIKNIKIPVLLMFGDQDHDNPTQISVIKWKEALDEAMNTNYEVKVFEGSGHGLVIGGHGANGFPKYAEGHIEVMKEFINRYVK